ncbi:MAG: ATP-dependent DNA ligase [Acidimicrobiales bacterium]
MLLIELARTSAAVAATASRREKQQLLAATLRGLAPDEIEPAVGLLMGAPRQGSLGVGWATVSRLQVEPAAEPSLPILALDTLLSELVATSGPGSVKARDLLLGAFLARATGDEHELVRRILIGDLRQGALQGVLTDAVALAAEVKAAPLRRAVMLQGDLGRAARIALVEGAEALAAVQLEVGRPIHPMLASTAADVAAAVEALGGTAQVEWKLDGARVQVHVEGDEVAIYTRNLNPVTDRLPHVVGWARSLDCRSAILDGEVLGFHTDDDGRDAGPRAFQDTIATFATQAATPGAGAAGGAGGFLVRPYFFDLMALDGRSLIDEPLHLRSAALGELVGDRRIPAVVATSPQEAAAHLESALANGHEGVMVKSVDGRYEAGRRGKSWLKVKPVHTLDLVVLAAEWGHGRRRGWLSNLHLGARHPDTGELVMVGKTFKGLTDELLAWQTEQFLARKVGEDASGHTVFVAPELVVEIALDGAQRSPRYPGGVALRFARVKGYRPDKSPAEADTLDAVRALL